jgi:hypothetical protein
MNDTLTRPKMTRAWTWVMRLIGPTSRRGTVISIMTPTTNSLNTRGECNMKTNYCPMCKPTLAYEDMNGNIHRSEQKCAEAQLMIMQERKADALVEMLVGTIDAQMDERVNTPFDRYLNISSPYFRRGERFGVPEFIETLVKYGYTIVATEERG